MYSTRQLKKVNQALLVQFYSTVIEFIITFSISVWFDSASSHPKRRPQRIFSVQRKSSDSSRTRKRAQEILTDPTHPGYSLFQWRLTAIKTECTPPPQLTSSGPHKQRPLSQPPPFLSATRTPLHRLTICHPSHFLYSTLYVLHIVLKHCCTLWIFSVSNYLNCWLHWTYRITLTVFLHTMYIWPITQNLTPSVNLAVYIYYLQLFNFTFLLYSSAI